MALQRPGDAIRVAGVQTSIHYLPIHEFSYYRQRYGDIALPAIETTATREVTLPLYPTMSNQSVEIVINSVQSAMEAASCDAQQRPV
jgi:dTDP-4-amino-4,6-dideoxygalactose transaminase